MKKDLNDEEFLDKIDEWHDGDFECELYEHLSMTLEEYSQMVMNGNTADFDSVNLGSNPSGSSKHGEIKMKLQYEVTYGNTEEYHTKEFDTYEEALDLFNRNVTNINFLYMKCNLPVSYVRMRNNINRTFTNSFITKEMMEYEGVF